MSHTVAIQGVKGSYHYQVAKEFFGDNTQLIECMTFDKAVDSLLNSQSDAMVMALENSIAGSILPNYARINANNLSIVGEYYLDVQHQFLALANQTISDIVEVRSHPMALLQCKAFFKKHPHIKLIEAQDTAAVAKDIAAQKLKGVAAIASTSAAQLFGLQIIAENIQTIKHNETRFAIVKRKADAKTAKNISKASLMFELSHKRGSLATVLNVMSDCKLNLTKIQSLPKIETPWKYAFFVDVTFNVEDNYKKALAILKIMAENFKVLGEYKNAQL